MGGTDTPAVKPDGSAAGMALAGLIAAGISLVVLPVTLVVIVVVRSVDLVPRAIHWVGRKAGRSWAQ